MAPVKCEENLRTPIEVKQEQCDDEDTYRESHAKHLAESSAGKPSSSSLSAVETDNNYEFLGRMKYEADESTDFTTTEPSSSSKHDIVCPLCQQVYYSYHKKREFISHLVKVHDYSHLRGHRRLAQCKGCKIKRERWTFVVGEGENYKFSDVCGQCKPVNTCRPITDNSDNLCQGNRRNRSMASMWKNFMAHQEMNAELAESPQATAETPTTAEGPDLQEDESATAEPPSSNKREIVCPLCQQLIRTCYRYRRKREFIAHLVKVHDYRHLRGYCLKTQCKSCKINRERWTFIVGEGNNYKFSDTCNRCEGYTWQPIADDSDGLHHLKNQRRQSIEFLRKNFMAYQAINELQENPNATTAETPSASETCD